MPPPSICRCSDAAVQQQVETRSTARSVPLGARAAPRGGSRHLQVDWCYWWQHTVLGGGAVHVLISGMSSSSTDAGAIPRHSQDYAGSAGERDQLQRNSIAVSDGGDGGPVPAGAPITPARRRLVLVLVGCACGWATARARCHPTAAAAARASSAQLNLSPCDATTAHRPASSRPALGLCPPRCDGAVLGQVTLNAMWASGATWIFLPAMPDIATDLGTTVCVRLSEFTCMPANHLPACYCVVCIAPSLVRYGHAIRPDWRP